MSSPNTQGLISKSSNLTSTNTSSITIPIQFSNLFHSNTQKNNTNNNKKENESESFKSQIIYINSNPKQYVVIPPNDDISYLNTSLSPPNFDSYHHYGSPKKIFKIVNDSSNNSPQIENQSIEKRKILIALAKKKISAFLPAEEVAQNEEKILENEIILKIYTENFLNDSYIDDVVRVMSFHPVFLKEFVKFHNYLMYSQGVLPYESRHYIAIMSASRHKCLYLVNQQETEFILQKGKKSWLSGLENIPQKLQDLNELNKLLCHQPWLINHGLIQKLLKNKFNNSWSITELIMAVTILIHFHAMSGFIFGCGINENYLQELILKKQAENEDCESQENTFSNKTKENYNQINNEKIRSEEEEIDFNEYEEEEDITENDLYNYNSKHQSLKNSFSSNRKRADSTGTINRTLSNSSASSCEFGIDLMLNEMKVIKEDGKQNLVSYIPISKTNEALFSGMCNNSPGNLTLTNSPIFGQINYLNDVSNCSNKTKMDSSYKLSYGETFNQFDDKNNDINDDSDLETDYNNNDRVATEDETYSNENSKHFKKRHCIHRVPNSQQEQHLSDVHNTNNFLKNRYMLKYVCDPDFGKLNFKNADQSLKLEYYTWENQGIRTTNSFYSDICDYLDKKFRIAGNMNFNASRSLKFDTSLLRRAVWLYVHSLYGIRYDDYDYNQIKELIGSPSRKYIKILCSCPERITFKEYDNMMKEFTHSEKVHINIVIMEARMQASILYFLRAVNAYFSTN